MGKVSIGQLKTALKDLINGKADATALTAVSDKVTTLEGKVTVYLRNNNGTLEWSADNVTWNAAGGGGIDFEYGLIP